MARATLLFASFLLLAACGKQEPEKTAPPAVPPAAQEQTARKAAEERARRIEELKARRTELRKQVRDLEAAYRKLRKENDARRKQLPDIAKLRRHFASLFRDKQEEAGKLQTMEKRFAELKRLAASRVTGELAALRAQEKEIEKRYEDIYSGWRREMEAASHGVVEESPARKALRTLRAIKEQWFKATGPVRAGRAGAKERRIISDGFRAWLKEREERSALAAKILGRPEAPEGARLDSYDFTNLDFFILIELAEDELDRANVAVERKQLSENYAKLQQIEKELDAVRERIARKMIEGGGDLERYEDLARRLPGQRRKVAELEQAVLEYGRIFQKAESERDALDRAEDEALQAIEKAKRELVQVARELRRLGAR